MLKTKPTGIHTSTDSFNEKPVVSPPQDVRRSARAHAQQRSKHGSGSDSSMSSAGASRATSPVRGAPSIPATAAPAPSSTPDLCAPAHLPDRHKALISAVCAQVIVELRQTVGWDIKIDEDLQVHSIDRKTLQGLLQKDYHINALQAWVLCRVMGVAYLPSQKKVVIVEEVTRSWHPELLAHEIGKGVVRLSLGLYANREAARGNMEALKYESKLDQTFCAEYDYRRGVRAMAAFHAAHAENVARKCQPTRHTEPVRQKLWGLLVWLVADSYLKVRAAGRKLADDIDRIFQRDVDAINLIYNHGRMTEQLYGGVGKVHIDTASRGTQERLKNLGNFLYRLNPRRGAVILQINLGSTVAFSRDD